MNKRNELQNLDETDIKLIRELEREPKQTHVDLTAKLGLGRDAVSARLQRLLETRTIKIVGLSDPIAIGYTTSVIMDINVQPSRLLSVAERLAALDPIQHVMLCMGRFQVMAFSIFQSRADYLDFLVNNIGNVPGILYIESLIVLRHTKLSGPLLSDGPGFCPRRTPITGLDSLDLALLKELQVDAMQDSRSLAKKLGTSQSTILRKTQFLQSEGVIRITTLINPLTLGYEGTASIGMRFDPSKVNEAAITIGSYRNVLTVAVCAGQYDIVVWILFRDLSDLSDFITLKLAHIPGLREVETMISLKIIKSSHRYELKLNAR